MERWAQAAVCSELVSA